MCADKLTVDQWASTIVEHVVYLDKKNTNKISKAALKISEQVL